VRAQLKQTWNQKLAAASIEGASEDQRRIFNTGLYQDWRPDCYKK
jgi:putative alpha-1,2-mannosidase